MRAAAYAPPAFRHGECQKDIIIQDGDEMRTLGRVLGQWTKGYPNDDIFGW